MDTATGFFAAVADRAARLDTPLCIGLDPHPEDAPRLGDLVEVCRRIACATSDYACAFKVNTAFFEAWGAPGLEALHRTLDALPPDVPVILDVKRGDISTTAQAYAQAAFAHPRVGAVTVSPYLGADAVAPFLAWPGRGVFVLCRTSNPGAAWIQDRPTVGAAGVEPLYEAVARETASWAPAHRLGLVVGATAPEALARVRAAAPDRWILSPGVGAQGGDLAAAITHGLRPDGLGLLVAVSRGVARAADPAAAARALVETARRARDGRPPAPRTASRLSPALAALADGLRAAGCIRFGRFTLKSGRISPIYLDLRRVVSDAGLLRAVASAYLPVIQGISYDHLAPLPYAGLPIGTAVALLAGRSLVYPRKETKGYGTRAEVEGVYTAGQRCLLLDDLATTGDSKFEAADRLRAAGLEVSDAVVLIDRESGAREAMAARGLRLHAALTLRELLDHWVGTGAVSVAQREEVLAFLAGGGP